MRRRLVRIIAANLTLIGALFVAIPQAAADCPDANEAMLFVHGITAPGGSDITDAAGTGGTLVVKNRDLKNCTDQINNPESHSTSHMEAVDDSLKMAEIGWVKNANGNFKWFWETNNDCFPDVCVGDLSDGGAIPDPGSSPYDARFWLNNVSGGNTWKLYADWTGDGQPDTSVTTGATGFHKGIPMGEVGRRPLGKGTGAQDHQSALQYLKQNGNWVSWGSNGHVVDLICDYDWSRVTDDEYRVQSVTPDTC